MAEPIITRHPPTTAPDAKVLYANSVDIGLTASDLIIFLKIDNRRQNELRISPSVAKTIAENLIRALEKYETITGTKVISQTDLSKAFNALSPTENASNS